MAYNVAGSGKILKFEIFQLSTPGGMFGTRSFPASGLPSTIVVPRSSDDTFCISYFTGTFESNDWYYLARDTRTFAFRDPKVMDQNVLHIRFDQAGNVASVNTTDETLIASIQPSKDKTPTLGREKSFFEELFGNIGSIRQPGLPGSQGQ